MEHFAGLDVSVKETSVCIVDDTGKIVREVKVASEPEALLAVLNNPAYHFKRIGLEAGPLSQWLFSERSGHPSEPLACPKSANTRHRAALFDHLIYAHQERVRYFQAKHLGRGQVKDEVELRGLLDGQIGRLRATKDLVRIFGGTAQQACSAWT